MKASGRIVATWVCSIYQRQSRRLPRQHRCHYLQSRRRRYIVDLDCSGVGREPVVLVKNECLDRERSIVREGAICRAGLARRGVARGEGTVLSVASKRIMKAGGFVCGV